MLRDERPAGKVVIVKSTCLSNSPTEWPQMVTLVFIQLAALGRCKETCLRVWKGQHRTVALTYPSHHQPLLGQAHPRDMSCWAWQLSLPPDSQCLAALDFHSQSTSAGAVPPSSKNNSVIVPLAFTEIKTTRSTITCFLMPDLLGSPSGKPLVQSCPFL